MVTLKEKIEDLMPHIDYTITETENNKLLLWIGVMDDCHIIWGGRPQMRIEINKDIGPADLTNLIKEKFRDLLKFALDSIGR